MTATASHVVVSGTVTEDQLIGSYFWSSIPEDSIAIRKVKKAFAAAGLDESLLPTERRPEHVAMQACRSVERVVSNGHREEIRYQQVDRTNEFWIGQITRHVQDKENRVIEHPKALRVMYSFEHDKLLFQALDETKMEDVVPIVREIQAHFDANGQRIAGHNLRTILRHYVEAAGAEKVSKRGGVYFLARENKLSAGNKLRAHHGEVIEHAEFLAKFEAALVGIYGDTADFHRLRCINDEGEREFLKKKFVENCAEDLKEYRDNLIELLATKDERKRGFRTDLRARLVEQRAELDQRRAKFADILGETLSELDRDMKLADQALVRFINEADA
jgi:hypothetical protein